MSYDKDTSCPRCGKQKEFMHECPAPSPPTEAAMAWLHEIGPTLLANGETATAFPHPGKGRVTYYSEQELLKQVRQARAAAFEEAAIVCDRHDASSYCAIHFRAKAKQAWEEGK